MASSIVKAKILIPTVLLNPNLATNTYVDHNTNNQMTQLHTKFFSTQSATSTTVIRNLTQVNQKRAR